MTPTEEELKDKEEPTFELVAVNYLGRLDVTFSQNMIIPHNKTNIDSSVFELEVLLDPTNDIDNDMSKVAFNWTVESYSQRSMTI